MARLNGTVAIVTGAVQGIGATYAKALAAEGARVSLCDLDPPDAAVLAIREAGGEAIAQVCDVSDPKAGVQPQPRLGAYVSRLDGLPPLLAASIAHPVLADETCRGEIRHLFNSARNCSSCALCGRSQRGYVSSFMPGVGLSREQRVARFFEVAPIF